MRSQLDDVAALQCEVQILRTDAKRAKAELCEAKEALLTAQRLHEVVAGLRAQRRQSAVRMLKQVTMRLVKGEVGMRLLVWKTAVDDHWHTKEMQAPPRRAATRP